MITNNVSRRVPYCTQGTTWTQENTHTHNVKEACCFCPILFSVLISAECNAFSFYHMLASVVYAHYLCYEDLCDVEKVQAWWECHTKVEFRYRILSASSISVLQQWEQRRSFLV